MYGSTDYLYVSLHQLLYIYILNIDCKLTLGPYVDYILEFIVEQ